MRILFVCTGNTCRSPLAEALLRRAAAERGSDAITVASAGAAAAVGMPASEGAYLVALEHGLDLSSHRASLLTREAVRDADLILAMGPSHLRRIEELGGGGKAHLLGAFVGRTGADAEVADPFGGELDGYREAYRQLEALVEEVLDRVPEGRGDHR